MTTVSALHPVVSPPQLSEPQAELVNGGRVGPVDRLPAEEILRLFRSVPVWADGGRQAQRRRIVGARKILEWLSGHPGEGWQQRWLAAGADHGVGWIDELVVEDTRAYDTQHGEIISGLVFLLLCRVMLPS
jgi:hypothetical protein